MSDVSQMQVLGARASRPTLRRWIGSAAGTVLSQAASSVSNLLLLIAVARVGTPKEVGKVALVAIFYQVAVGATRAVLGDVALVRRSIVGRLDGAAMQRSAIAVGSLAAAVFAIVGVAGGRLTLPIAVLAPFMPLLIVQDSLRYVSFADQRPMRAARGDVTWVVLFLGVMSVWAVQGYQVGAQVAVALWAACGVVSIVAIDVATVCKAARVRSRWIRESGRLPVLYVPDYLITLSVTVIPTFIVGAIGGLSQVAGLSLATSFLGPITIMWSAVVNLATPALAGTRRVGLRPETAVSSVMAAGVAIWVVIGSVTPVRLVEHVAGTTWITARLWLPWVGLGYVALASYGGATVGLRTRNSAHRALRSRAVAAPLTLLLPAGGYWLAGRTGFGVGMMVAGAVTSYLLWRQLALVSSAQHHGAST